MPTFRNVNAPSPLIRNAPAELRTPLIRPVVRLQSRRELPSRDHRERGQTRTTFRDEDITATHVLPESFECRVTGRGTEAQFSFRQKGDRLFALTEEDARQRTRTAPLEEDYRLEVVDEGTSSYQPVIRIFDRRSNTLLGILPLPSRDVRSATALYLPDLRRLIVTHGAYARMVDLEILHMPMLEADLP